MSHQTTSLFFLLSALLLFNPSSSYSLKNCTIDYSDDVANVICTNRDLAAIPDDVPKTAASLQLNFNRIWRINTADLSGLSNLSSLDINSNLVSRVDDGAFADLVELETLSLMFNRLTNLTDNMFRGLSKLQKMYLTNNQITSISLLAFQPLISLQKVILNLNYLHQMTDIVTILQLPNIHHLDVSLNLFASFGSDDLHFNTSNLRELLLYGNPLIEFIITTDMFPHLQFLDLSYCSPGFVWDVPDKTFLRSLTTLFLAGANISFETYSLMLQSVDSVEYLMFNHVKEWFHKGLIDVACQIPALRTLDLISNEIAVLNDTLLQHCSKIFVLSLVNNDLTDLSKNSLRALNRLEKLRLDINLLTRVPPAIRGLSRLTILHLRRNDIGELGCFDFLRLPNLVELSLESNRISTLRGCTFQDLKSLRVLLLEENPVFQLDERFGVSLQNLGLLDMPKNRFVELNRGEFRNLSSLQLLDFESVLPTKVDNGAFEGLDSLEVLVLTPRFLLKDMFLGLPRLKRLILNIPFFTLADVLTVNEPFMNVPSLMNLQIVNNNRYTTLIVSDLLKGLNYLETFSAVKLFNKTPDPNTFTYTPRLTSLQIISSNFSYLKPKLFQPIPKLQILDLSKNKLRSLEFLMQANLSELRYLNLRHNELTVIDVAVFQSLPALTYLDLFANLFTCDCSNAGFIQWVKNNQTQVANAYQYICSFPPTKQGGSLLEFDTQSCWMDTSFVCFISSTCLVALTLLSSFIYHFLRWQLFYAYYLFLAFLYDSRKRKKETPHRYDAFISYNVHDEDWVYAELLPVLEGEQGWRLCLHHRDFQPGKPIIENITDSIYGSRKTICVISRRYLQSEWCSREIQMASFRLFDEQKDVLILLFLEEIPAWELSPYYRVRKLVKRRTYLSWPQTRPHRGVFWQNVRRALETADAPADGANVLSGYNET